MFQTKFVEKTKTHVLYSTAFSETLMRQCGKNGRARKVTYDIIILRMRFVYWINKVRIKTHT